MNFDNQETWRFINGFAPWFSALGTISALTLSLYLARRDSRLNLDVSIGHRALFTPGSSGPPLEYLCIRIINTGKREAQITGAGWRCGFFRKKYYVLNILGDRLSSPLPVRLKDGEDANYFIPLSDGKNWLKDFSKEIIQDNHPSYLNTLKLMVFTSIGKTFQSKPEDGVLRRMKQIVKDERKGRN